MTMVRIPGVPFLGTACLLLAVLFATVPPVTASGFGDMVQVTDMAGRTCMIPKVVKRIVPIGGALRFVVYMQALHMVVGIEALEQQKPVSAGRLYSLAVTGMAGGIPAIGEGGPGRIPDFERLLAVRPDVILAMGVDTPQAEAIQQKTGIPVLVLSYGSLGSLDLEETIASIRILGQVLDRKERAGKLSEYIETCRRDLQERASSVQQRPSVYIGAISFKGTHGITSTCARYEPVGWINGRNVADETGLTGHLFVDPEKILLWDPDVVFIDTAGVAMMADDYRKKPAFYRGLRAVRESRVFSVFPSNSYHNNLEITIANAYFMGKTLYPEAFSDIDPEAKADEIFRNFIGIPAYARLKKEYGGWERITFGDDGTLSIR